MNIECVFVQNSSYTIYVVNDLHTYKRPTFIPLYFLLDDEVLYVLTFCIKARHSLTYIIGNINCLNVRLYYYFILCSNISYNADW